MTRPLAVALAIATLAAPSVAHAASLTANPAKSCYRSGETVHFLGDGFTASSSANLSRDSVFVAPIPTDAAGRFDAGLRLLQDRGQQDRTYTATDSTNAGISASAPVTVSAVGVGLSPKGGPVSRRFRIRARGFTTGRTLWAHVVQKRSKRLLKIGRLKGACHNLSAHRRLLPKNARLGRHRIQFDTFRRYRANRPVERHFSINVVRGGR
ncbi:MAG TPA: hypothetical protein VK486_05130 [Thermoleophilaceae bacterium]|nr:hypothetical protein [Thermoleophilaceae bacterium]